MAEYTLYYMKMTINDQKVFISDLKITKNYETKFRNGFVLM